MTVRFQNNLNNQNLTVSKKQQIIEQLTETLDFNDDIFDLEHINTDLAEVRVTINLIELEKKLFNRVEISNDYTTNQNDHYIAVDSRENRIAITMHEGFEGENIYIKDEFYNSSFRPVTIYPDGALIDNKEKLVFAINGFGARLIYTESQWRIV